MSDINHENLLNLDCSMFRMDHGHLNEVETTLEYMKSYLQSVALGEKPKIVTKFSRTEYSGKEAENFLIKEINACLSNHVLSVRDSLGK